MAKAAKLRFLRWEFKYILPTQLRKAVEAELNYFIELDPFVAAKPDARYMVRSLYFDDPHMSAYLDKIDGLLTRYKFRVRTYTDDPDEGCATFLEIKGRNNNMVFKYRCPLDVQGEGVFSHGQKNFTDLVLNRAEPGNVLEQFKFDLYRKRIGPIMLIDYQRRPYFSKYDPEFRVTFDSDLCATKTRSLFPGPTDRTRVFLPEYSIMEIKFRYHVPAWFHRIIQSYELRRVSVSKICRGIERFAERDHMDLTAHRRRAWR